MSNLTPAEHSYGIIAAAAESWKDHGILHVCFEDNQLRYHIAVCELIPRCNLACLVSAGACQELDKLFEVTLADRPASQDHKLSPYVASLAISFSIKPSVHLRPLNVYPISHAVNYFKRGGG